MPPKSLYPKKNEATKIRTRDMKIAICVSIVWVVSFLFLLLCFHT